MGGARWGAAAVITEGATIGLGKRGRENAFPNGFQGPDSVAGPSFPSR